MVPILTVVIAVLCWTAHTRAHPDGRARSVRRPAAERRSAPSRHPFLVLLYQSAAWPLRRAARRASYQALDRPHHVAVAALDGLLSVWRRHSDRLARVREHAGSARDPPVSFRCVGQHAYVVNYPRFRGSGRDGGEGAVSTMSEGRNYYRRGIERCRWIDQATSVGSPLTGSDPGPAADRLQPCTRLGHPMNAGTPRRA
jgi:hypothetical protein